MVEASELDVIGAIAFIGPHRGRGATKAIGPGGGTARCPLHGAIAEGHVRSVGHHRVGPIGDDDLKGVQLIGHHAVVSHIGPVHIERGRCHLVLHNVVVHASAAQVHVRPERCHHRRTARGECAGAECADVGAERDVAVDVDVGRGKVLAVQEEIEGQVDGTVGAIVTVAESRSVPPGGVIDGGVARIRGNPAITGGAAPS